MRNLWQLPLQRLEIYCQPFQRPGGYFKVSPQASCNGSDWIGMERHFAVIEESIPFRLLSKSDYFSLLKQHFRGPSQAIDRHACTLIDYLNTRPNYFHWFLDALPRIFAAESYKQLTGRNVSIVIPENLRPWQWDSLRYLGVQESQLIQVPAASPVRSWSFAQLITTFSHRHIRRSATGHFDAFSPDSIQTLANRLLTGVDQIEGTAPATHRLYVSRGHATLRRVQNEDEIIDFLCPYGFKRVCLDELPLHQQIKLFQGATHVISAHGGALTNLLYVSPGCQVLEIFQTGHGIRPDFFQLAALRGADYSFYEATSLNKENEIVIPIGVLRTFLDSSL
ncbi:MAG: hypothetical protein RLZZ609_1584 [Cyanobacteriota bacterium]